MTLGEIFSQWDARRQNDARRYDEAIALIAEEDLCMLCEAKGYDKRSLMISCGYDVSEVVPEAITLKGISNEANKYGGSDFWWLRICKSCRARLLDHLKQWSKDCVTLRPFKKDHDGYLDNSGDDGDIPVRVNGAIKWMTMSEFKDYLTES